MLLSIRTQNMCISLDTGVTACSTTIGMALLACVVDCIAVSAVMFIKQ